MDLVPHIALEKGKYLTWRPQEPGECLSGHVAKVKLCEFGTVRHIVLRIPSGERVSAFIPVNNLHGADLLPKYYVSIRYKFVGSFSVAAELRSEPAPKLRFAPCCARILDSALPPVERLLLIYILSFYRLNSNSLVPFVYLRTAISPRVPGKLAPNYKISLTDVLESLEEKQLIVRYNNYYHINVDAMDAQKDTGESYPGKHWAEAVNRVIQIGRKKGFVAASCLWLVDCLLRPGENTRERSMRLSISRQERPKFKSFGEHTAMNYFADVIDSRNQTLRAMNDFKPSVDEFGFPNPNPYAGLTKATVNDEVQRAIERQILVPKKRDRSQRARPVGPRFTGAEVKDCPLRKATRPQDARIH